VKKQAKKVISPLFEKMPKKFGIEQDIQLFVKWSHYIRLQQQRAILHKHLKASPAMNQFIQLLNCLSQPTNTDQRKGKRRSRDCWPRMKRKLWAKGSVPAKKLPVFERGVILLPP